MSERTPIVSGRVWACEPRALERLAKAEAAWLKGDAPKSRRAAEKTNAYRVSRGGVAVIEVHGLILRHDMPWLRFFGIEYSTTESLRTQLRDAVGSPDTTGIFLDVDSPGGTVEGVADLADEIFAARGVLPVTAHANEFAASAALWLGSQADLFETSQTGEVGSMGVYLALYDMSEMAAEAGIRVVLIRTGEHKGVGVPGFPISEANEAMLQESVDDTMSIFTAAVARGRGDRLSKENLEALSDARIVVGARAKRLGLIDTIRTAEQSLAALENTGRTTARAAHANESTGAEAVSVSHSDDLDEVVSHSEDDMGDTKKDPVAAFAAEHAEAVEQWRDEGRTEASGADIKRAEALKEAFPDRDAFALEQFVKGNDIPAAKAELADVLLAENEALSKRVETALEEGRKSAATEETGVGFVASETEERKVNLADLGPEERWEKDAKLRDEFGGDKDGYLAYTKAEAAGQVRILSKGGDA
jgi:signal peptide peptidase SppA